VERLNNQQILDAGLADWRKLSQPLHARYLTTNIPEAADFVAAVAMVVEADSEHLEMKLAHGAVDLSLCTREDGLWVTQKDIDLARNISAIAQLNGLKADLTAATQRWDSIPRTRTRSDLSGRCYSRAARTTRSMTRSSTPPVGSQSSGSRARATTTHPASAGTSIYDSHPNWPTSGSPQPCQLAGLSSIRLEHHPSPFSRILTATGSASVAPRDAD
jgi:pterin-4a-carbinolamine dehydratase